MLSSLSMFSRVVLSLLLASPASAFWMASLQGRLTLARSQIFACSSSRVTADDVAAAIENAEALWAVALAARERANALSAEAEELSNEAATQTGAATAKLGDKFSLSMLGDARIAMDSAMEVQRLLSEAVDAAEEADRCELEAEAALQASEAALEQHELDFPSGE